MDSGILLKLIPGIFILETIESVMRTACDVTADGTKLENPGLGIFVS